MTHGGRILVDQLRANGVDTVYCVPGESYLAALDGLYDRSDIRTVVCRQEGGAAMMAEAHGKLTGRPGICFVTRGPGATNAAIGVHIARQDSTPMILFVGLPATGVADREAFQEFDLTTTFGALGKWAGVINDADRIPEYVNRAFNAALSGRPGPVVIGLPEDVLSRTGNVKPTGEARPAYPSPRAADMAVLAERLFEANRPLAIIGGPGWSTAVKSRLEAFASRFDLPVGVAFRYQDYFDNTHPSYVGHIGIGLAPTLCERIEKADLLLVLGARLGEITTQGYRVPERNDPSQYLVHVHPSADELGSVYQANLPICATAETFTAALADLKPREAPDWALWRTSAREDYEALLEPKTTPGAVKLETIMQQMSDMLPEGAIITNGAGNYTAWIHRYRQFTSYRSHLGSTAGAMGYGVPAAIAAKHLHPERTVVAFAGDGCFLMNGQEMATAAQYGLPIIIVVINNAMYGTIRMHQERAYPDRVMATSLMNPDFAAMAQSFGGHGEVVERTADFEPAFERALHADRFTLIEVRTDPNALTPVASLEEIRDASLKEK